MTGRRDWNHFARVLALAAGSWALFAGLLALAHGAMR